MRNDRILLCRKASAPSLLILPGGCFEPSETAEMCLRRELTEELGPVRALHLQFVGTYRDVAAGNTSNLVQIELYRGDLVGEPSPHAEIAEVVWFGASDDRDQLAPSIRRTILPDLLSRHILTWPA